MAVNVKLGVDLGDFNQNINQAKSQIKTFDAALKQAESRFKATGDAESAMATKTSNLTAKFQAQKKIVDQYREALQKANDQGVSKLNSEYQKLQQQMLVAESAMWETQAALNGLSASEQSAAAGADALTKSVNGIGKKISLDQVINGVQKITDGLEKGAQKAIQLGKEIWNAVMDSARRADDVVTQAEMYDIPLQRYKQMLALEAQGLDTSVDAILSAQKKLGKGIGGGNQAAWDALRDLNVSIYETFVDSKGVTDFRLKDAEQSFWDIGQALMKMGEGFDKEAAAQALFGQSWNKLVPLFKSFKSLEEYENALSTIEVTTEQATLSSAELADKVSTLENTWTTLKDEIIGAVAPGLTAAAESLDSVLSTILEYLQKPEGQEMLNKLGESVAGLFDDLSEVNPEDVVNNFVTVFDKLTSGLEFLKNNWSAIVEGIKAIGVAFGLLKIGEGVLEGLRLINGFNTMTGNDKTVNPQQPTGPTPVEKTILNATGAMIMIDYDPAKALQYQQEYGKRYAFAKQLDDDYGTNLYELQREWDANRPQSNGPSFLEQVVNSPKNLASIVWNALTDNGKAGDWSAANGDDWSVKVKPEAEPGANEDIAEQVGEVTIPVNLRVNMGGSAFAGGGGGGGIMDQMMDAIFGSFRPGYANGIPFVPETRLAWLHQGERVLTARENRNYTFNNNTYFGGVNLHNGMEVDALTDSIAKRQARQQAAYGV